jgi:integrase
MGAWSVPKVVQDVPISSRAARARLAAGLYWRGLDTNTHIGYRKGKRSSKWIVRWYKGTGHYQQLALGAVDDVLDADGATTLNFEQARKHALEWVQDAMSSAVAAENGPIITVRDAVNEYIAKRDIREISQKDGIAVKHDARSKLTKHVLSDEISDIALHAIVEWDIQNWSRRISVKEAKRNGKTKLEGSTVARISTDFKAALNTAARKYRSKLPATLATVIERGFETEDLEEPEPSSPKFFSDDHVRSLLQAARLVDTEDGWDGDLEQMLALLAGTGARFSQLIRMKVADVQFFRERLIIPVSRKGNSRSKRTSKQRMVTVVAVGVDVLELLRGVAANREPGDYLFERWYWRQTSPTVWVKAKRGPWKTASQLTRPFNLILMRANLTPEATPYWLRHSSIIRHLRSGLPARLVAAYHDTSTEMIERHYAAHIIDALDELSTRAIIPLLSQPT